MTKQEIIKKLNICVEKDANQGQICKSNIINCIPKEYLQDKEFIIKIIPYSTMVLNHIDDTLKNDKEFISKISNNFNYSLKYASDELRNDKEFMKELVIQDNWNFNYICIRR